MNRRGIGIRLTCLCVLAAASPAFAAPEGDWPCIQPRVVTLGVAQMWSGPPLDQAFARWRDDAEVAALVRSLVPRRVTMDEAAAAIDRFAAAAGPQKTEKLTLLFAGLFEIINADRQRLVGGIERYARRQRALSEDIGETARTLSDASIPASQKEAIEERLRWDRRIYDERNQSLIYVCETPVILEQRAFGLAREIARHLE